MQGNHPKRRRDKQNPYRIYEIDGQYYVTFKEGKEIRNLKVTKEVFNAFDEFELNDKSYLNEWDRHIEHSDVWETSINERAVEETESVEETVLRRIEYEKLHIAIEQLPEVQRRRIELYYFEGLTYEQIAEVENCKHPAVMKSVKAALEKIKKFLEE